MKKAKKAFFRFLFILSVVCNLLLSYYLYENLRPTPSIMRFGFSEHNIDVYCERAEDVEIVTVYHADRRYIIGEAELHSREDLYFITPDGEINLSEIGGEAFVINSDGELLYQLMKPEKEEFEKVFATPSGKKYHSDTYCAGRTAFETDLEMAELFGRRPCSICFYQKNHLTEIFNVSVG